MTLQAKAGKLDRRSVASHPCVLLPRQLSQIQVLTYSGNKHKLLTSHIYMQSSRLGHIL